MSQKRTGTDAQFQTLVCDNLGNEWFIWATDEWQRPHDLPGFLAIVPSVVTALKIAIPWHTAKLPLGIVARKIEKASDPTAEEIPTAAVATLYRLVIHFNGGYDASETHYDLPAALESIRIAKTTVAMQFASYDLFVEHPLVLGGR